MKIQDLRRNYDSRQLSLSQLAADPVDQFRNWFEQLQTQELPEWFEKNAMTLATSQGGQVSSRIVLLKQFDAHGFYFFTNYDSIKSAQIEANPNVSLNFYWPSMERQVRIEGSTTRTERQTSIAYFQSRPLSSQAGAIVSKQSSVIDESDDLEARSNELLSANDSKEPLPCPENWGGWCVKPIRFEFWQGRPSRLHDRYQYRLQANQQHWVVERLAP